MTRLHQVFAALVVITLTAATCGCGASSNKSFKAVRSPVGGTAPEPPAAAQEAPRSEVAKTQPDKQEAVGKEVTRKIVYNATLRLIVEDFHKASDEFLKLVEDHQGYVAHTVMTASPGAARQAQWKVRVPVEQQAKFRKAVAGMGQVETDTLDSDDITDKYYDLERRIKNKKRTEERLLKELEKAAGDNIRKIDNELEAVQETIEVMQGQLERWGKLSALATCDVTFIEKQKYIADRPPDKTETPTFGMRVGRTFESSWGTLRDLGENVALVVVALAPWVPLLAVLGIGLWFFIRRAWNPTEPLIPIKPVTGLPGQLAPAVSAPPEQPSPPSATEPP